MADAWFDMPADAVGAPTLADNGRAARGGRRRAQSTVAGQEQEHDRHHRASSVFAETILHKTNRLRCGGNGTWKFITL